MEEKLISRKFVINVAFYLNSTLAILDRVFQIVFYFTTDFYNDKLKSNSLCFILLKPLSLIIIFSIYITTLKDDLLFFGDKLKNWITFGFSQEISFPIGVHYSIKSKYSKDGDPPIFTVRIINALHIMFISIPQIIIVTLNSFASEKFSPIDTISLLLSSVFIIWNIFYFLLCGFYSKNIEEEINDYIY